VGIEAVSTLMKATAARFARRLGPPGGRPGPARRPAGGQPSRLRSFEPARIADLEYRAWVGYYLRQWPQVLAASVGLVRTGFGMDWYRTLHGAWLVLRANQMWAPFPYNHPDRARACMRRVYALVKLSYGQPANPAKAGELEVDWWRAHRETKGARSPGAPAMSWSSR
jgi:hypothetical protein